MTVEICLYLCDLFRQVIMTFMPRVVFVMMMVPWDVLAVGFVQSLGFIQITEVTCLPLAAAVPCLLPDRLPSPRVCRESQQKVAAVSQLSPHVRSHYSPDKKGAPCPS
jgi:hypothetical protein